MKICTIVGARPQFIKAAALSRVLRERHTEVLIHTGQHYDRNMSDIFFEELDIPRPDYNLGISGGTHGGMTGEMLIAAEDILIKEKPDMTLVYGDTNSTLAGALASVKKHIPVCHVEAGVRIRTLKNPEEVNRVLVDRISSLLLCCTQTAVQNLKEEGITEGVYNTGDLMYDALLYYGDKLRKPAWLPDRYYLLTCHREENTDDETMRQILSAMQALDAPAVYPVHPRNRERAARVKEAGKFCNVILTEPVGYLESLYLVKNAERVVTDSGGLQREAWFYGVPCVTLLNEPPWPETLGGNMNQMCSAEKEEILLKLFTGVDVGRRDNVFGDGTAAEKIAGVIGEYLDKICLMV
jgi:UDP-N-acetylglucosamine 2-epimerase (non-hydrolysing)/UDP-GlcNAc3NAcA epimerase